MIEPYSRAPVPAFPFAPARRRTAVALAVAALLCGVCAGAADTAPSGGVAAAPRVLVFSPQGSVKGPQQASARFSTAMVPFGDLRDVAPPFRVDCAARGTSRWIDATTWAYDFEKPLPSGLRCTFTLAEHLRSVDGTEVGGPNVFAFDTGTPSITTTYPYTGDSTIDEHQVFLVGLDGDVDPASVREHAGFVVEGLRERIEVDLVAGKELEALVASLPKWSLPSPPLVGLRARRTFPNDKSVVLEWGPGIRPASGNAGGAAGESPQSLAFHTRPLFSATARCRRENAKSGCLPIAPINVEFSAPVANAAAAALRLVGPDGVEREPVAMDDDTKAAGFTESVSFRGPFAENTTYTVRMPAGLHDDAGRTLPKEQAATLAVKTGAGAVLAKFAARFGIVESKGGAALPVTLRNVEKDLAATGALAAAPTSPGFFARMIAGVRGKDARVPGADPKTILAWLKRVGGARRTRTMFDAADPSMPAGAGVSTFTLPKPGAKEDTEVVGIPLKGNGLHVVELASPTLGAALLGRDAKMFVPAAALVTNLAVHFKRGRESSIAWVTTLDDAKPVRGAHVVVADCTGKEVAAADTDAQGVARFAALPANLPDWTACRAPQQTTLAPGETEDWADDRNSSAALSGLESGLLVVATSGDDMSFVHTSWDQGIESWRFNLPDSYFAAKGSIASTIFDRGLYRQGETVHMKHVLRERVLKGFAIPGNEGKGRPTTVAIEHVGSGERREFPVVFDDRGIATGDWTLPADAKLGAYTVRLGWPHPAGAGAPADPGDDGDDGESAAQGEWLDAGSFRVSAFRVPLMRAELGAPPFIEPRATSVAVDVAVNVLSGGPAAGLPVVLRSELAPASFAPPDDYLDYVFAMGPLREGFDDEESDGGEGEEAAPAEGPKPLGRRDVKLDAAGSARVVVGGLPKVTQPTDLVLEAEYRDPNGEVKTVSTTRQLLPASRIPGIRVDDWTATGQKLKPRVVVLTPDGKPVAGAPVAIDAARHQRFYHRKRLVGGFYAYVSSSDTRRLGRLCEGRTGADGIFTCEAPAPATGQLMLEANVTDDRGREALTRTSVWVAGEETGFETGPGDRIDVVPEKKSYAPGETARLQVRMPFREATALVTVEREGVASAAVTTLRGDRPVVEVPIGGEYAPNVFVSVLLVRGRVSGVEPTALVDLGRPAYKLGIAEIAVDPGPHRLGVTVTSDREVYRTRETAHVHVAVKRADGSHPAAGSEVAVAAVDEGLLELAPNRSWDLLAAMMGRRPYEVQTSTAQAEVIGKRHFGRKATPGGGGGGRAPTRELFDTLLLWSPRVKLDARGEADVEVPVNDSLTSFRIVAVATGDAGEFGSGAATIRSTRELSIASGLPPLVREGDRFVAEFTVRNSSNAPLAVKASGTVEGLAAALAPQDVTLAPGEGRVLTWPIDVPHGRGQLVYTMEASAPPSFADRLKVTERVIPAERVQVIQSSLEQLDGRLSVPVHLADGADPSAAGSGLRVAASASLSSSVQPVKDWFARYPYSCLEQRVSIAIGSEDDKAWQAVVDSLGGYIDGRGLLRYFPGRSPGDDRLTAYVLSISIAAGRRLPEAIAQRLADGLRGFVAGTVVPGRGPMLPDLALRKLAAIAALARAGAAEPSMLASIVVQPQLWPTSALLDWWTILLELKTVGDRDARLAEVESVLRSRLDLSGTTLAFAGPRWQGALWWMMSSPDSDATRLLLLLAEHGLWKEDAPRLLRGTVARRQGGAWQTTVANAWGVLGMRAFAKSYEAEAVGGTTGVTLAGARASIAWSSPSPAPVTLPWPRGDATLDVVHDGKGKPWITTTALAALPLRESVSAGYRLTRRVKAAEGPTPEVWHRGDRMVVTLEIDAQRDMWWVAIDDPIPSGASHLASSWRSAASCEDDDCDDEEWSAGDGLLYPAYVEASYESWRGYVRYLPRGHHRIEYTIRLNQAGTFHLPASRVEALYAPEIFGELPNATLEVAP